MAISSYSSSNYFSVSPFLHFPFLGLCELRIFYLFTRTRCTALSLSLSLFLRSSILQIFYFLIFLEKLWLLKHVLFTAHISRFPNNHLSYFHGLLFFFSLLYIHSVRFSFPIKDSERQSK